MEKRKVRIIIKASVMMRPLNCNHKRIKRNFPFGKKSQPRRHCKDCNAIVSAKMIRDKIPKRRMQNE